LLTVRWTIADHVKMDSDRLVGYFRIEMSDARRMFLPIALMLVSPYLMDVRSVLVEAS